MTAPHEPTAGIIGVNRKGQVLLEFLEIHFNNDYKFTSVVEYVIFIELAIKQN